MASWEKFNRGPGMSVISVPTYPEHIPPVSFECSVGTAHNSEGISLSLFDVNLKHNIDIMGTIRIVVEDMGQA